MFSVQKNVYKYLLPNLLETQRISFCWFLELGFIQELENFSAIRDYMDELELNLLKRTPEVHDKQMAYVQALTHFIGRAINEIDIPDIEQKTPAYQFLLNICIHF